MPSARGDSSPSEGKPYLRRKVLKNKNSRMRIIDMQPLILIRISLPFHGDGVRDVARIIDVQTFVKICASRLALWCCDVCIKNCHAVSLYKYA